jgi:hypothetical protein
MGCMIYIWVLRYTLLAKDYAILSLDVARGLNPILTSFSVLSLFKMPGGFDPPPSVIASWPQSNYVDPDARGKELIVFSGVLGIASLLAVVSRIYVRVKIQKRLGTDDYCLVLGLVLQPLR